MRRPVTTWTRPFGYFQRGGLRLSNLRPWLRNQYIPVLLLAPKREIVLAPSLGLALADTARANLRLSNFAPGEIVRGFNKDRPADDRPVLRGAILGIRPLCVKPPMAV
jgi:hypothetical protein